MRSHLPKGKGFYIWKIRETEKGDPVKIAEEAVKAGFEHVLLHIHDGSYDETRVSGGAKLEPYIKELYARNLQVWGWGAVYPDWWRQTVPVIVNAVKNYGLDGYVTDIEHPMKNRPNESKAFIETLRGQLPDIPIGMSSYRYPSYHREIAWDIWREHIDFDMPQVYWEKAQDSADQLQRSYNEYRKFNRKLPYIPTGAAYKWDNWQPTNKSIVDFLNKVKELKFPAVNFWCWFQTKRDLPELWNTISKFKLSETTLPDPIPIPDPAPDPAPDPIPGVLNMLLKTRFNGQRVRTTPQVKPNNIITSLPKGTILQNPTDYTLTPTEMWLYFPKQNTYPGGWIALFYGGKFYLEKA